MLGGLPLSGGRLCFRHNGFDFGRVRFFCLKSLKKRTGKNTLQSNNHYFCHSLFASFVIA